MHPSSRFKVIGVCSLLVLFSASLTALAAPKIVRAASTMGLEPARPSMSSTNSALSCGPWQFVSSPNVGTGDNRLEGVAAVSAKDVWAVGSGPGGTLTEHWNGTQWSIVPSPNPSSGSGIFYAVTAISSNNIWAVGLSFLNNGNEATLTEHWNGSKWSLVPSPNNTFYTFNELLAVSATSANDVWAVGDIAGPDPDSDTFTLIEHWNGSKWSIVPSANVQFEQNFLKGVRAVSASDVWAVGFTEVGGTPPDQGLIEHWNGSKWSLASFPRVNSDYRFYAVSATSASDVWAVGLNGSTNLPAPIEHWNGSKWSIVPNPVLTGSRGLISVASLTTASAWAVGSNGSAALFEHWNGVTWKIVAGPPQVGAANELASIARVPGTSMVWAVGFYLTPQVVSRTLIAFHC